MNFRKQLLKPVAVLLLGVSTLAAASDKEAANALQQAALEAEYRQALKSVEAERAASEASMVKARQQLESVEKQKSMEAERSVEALAAQDAELAAMNEELARARRQLSETSREIARVNREVSRERARGKSTRFVVDSSDQPVIGVILGDSSDVGIEVLGVSPDGPSDRAGIKQGDVIIALGGRVLSAVDDTGDVQNGLNIAMEDIKATEPVIVSVERGDETLDIIVIPEVREPLTWHSVTRFASAPDSPSAPDHVIRIEQLVVPDIDTEALTKQIEVIRADIDTRRLVMEAKRAVSEVDFEFEYEFHELSEMGDVALHEANVWFGMPMTRGLKLAELDAGLGEYFKTDRGVLVLKARDDNDLHLQSGDVILMVGDTEVNSPAEFMRALREFDSGQELTIDIKRDRKNKSLKTTMPESRTSFYTPQDESKHRIHIKTSTD